MIMSGDLGMLEMQPNQTAVKSDFKLIMQYIKQPKYMSVRSGKEAKCRSQKTENEELTKHYVECHKQIDFQMVFC